MIEMPIFGNSWLFQRTIFCLIAFFVFSWGNSAFAAEATLSLSPGDGSFNMGDTFSVKVMAESSGEAMNAAEVKLGFDKNVLQVVSVSKDGSAFSLWTVEPTFSNSEGTIEFGGGNPKPITSKVALVTISFKSLKTGNTKVDFVSGSVLAADGKGTDILSQRVPGTYEIKPKPAASLPPTTGSTTPPLPVIESSTHPEIGVWYNVKKIKFTWAMPIGVLSVRSAFDDQPETSPLDLEPPATTSKEIEASQDGTWYLHLQFKNKDVWGPVAHRKVMIDTASPKDFEVSVEPGFDATSLPSLKIKAADELSGIRNYEITIGNNSPVVIKQEDLKDDLYPVPEMDDGKYPVTVRVFDNAGNKEEKTLDLELKTGRVPAKASTEEEVEEKSWFQKFRELFSIEIIIIIILTGALGYVLYKMMQQKKLIFKDREFVRKGAMDIRVLMGKIFSALIDEIEEQLIAIDHKPRLNENEQRIFDKIKEAIDISEGLIDDQIKAIEKSIEE